MSFSPIFHTSLVASIELPTEAEFKAKLEEGFTEFSNYFVVLFAVTALVFVIKGITS